MYKTESAEYGWTKDLKIPLREKIKQDLKTSMLNKDLEVRDTIRLVMGEYPNLTVPITLESGKKTTRVKKPEEITDDDIQDIIRKLAKSEKTVLELKQLETSEYLKILESYLPQMASNDEIMQWIDAHIDFSEFKSPMQAMGSIMKHFGKLADGNMVKEILKNMGEKKK